MSSYLSRDIFIPKSLLAIFWVIYIAFVLCALCVLLHSVLMGELCLREDFVQSLCDLFSTFLFSIFGLDMYYCVLFSQQTRSLTCFTLEAKGSDVVMAICSEYRCPATSYLVNFFLSVKLFNLLWQKKPLNPWSTFHLHTWRFS